MRLHQTGAERGAELMEDSPIQVFCTRLSAGRHSLRNFSARRLDAADAAR
jgi:hypothetical protein